MWRALNIVIGISLVISTASAAAYGYRLDNDSAERFAEAGMQAFVWVFIAQGALMVLMALLTFPWDAKARTDEQRSTEGLAESIRHIKRRYVELAELRHSPRFADKAQALISTTFLWLFFAQLGIFVTMIATIAGCPGC
jgi:hypothetical protein